MTAPISPTRINDLLEELQQLETKPANAASLIAPIPVIAKKVVVPALDAPESAPAPQEEAKRSLPAAKRPLLLAAITGILCFAAGILSSDFFTIQDVDNEEVVTNMIDLSSYDSRVAAFDTHFKHLATERQTALLQAINEGRPDLDKAALDSHNLTSHALLQDWAALDAPELRQEFVDLATMEGLRHFLPAQVTSDEKLRPLYYFSDSDLHINLTDLHQNILHDLS